MAADAARAVRHRVQGRRGARAAARRPDRRARRRSTSTWPRWPPRPASETADGARPHPTGRAGPARSAALPSPPRGYAAGAAAGVGRPRRRSRRPGGHRRRCRARTVRLVAHPLRDGGRRRAVGGRRARAGVDHRAGQAGRTTRSRAGTTPRPASWSTRPRSSSATTTPWSSAVGIREFVDDGAIDRDHRAAAGVGVPRQGLHLRRCRRRPRPGRSSQSDPEHTVDHAGARRTTGR